VSNEFEQVAAMLREAYDGQVLPPLRDWLEPTDAAGAYAVQGHCQRDCTASGGRSRWLECGHASPSQTR
jgi:2-keto-4-pentenoate hydratase